MDGRRGREPRRRAAASSTCHAGTGRLVLCHSARPRGIAAQDCTLSEANADSDPSGHPRGGLANRATNTSGRSLIPLTRRNLIQAWNHTTSFHRGTHNANIDRDQPVIRDSQSQELLQALRIGVLAALASVAASAVDFGRDIQPLLADRCFACHGPDAAQRQAGLRLDIRAAALAPSASGRTPIRPGNPDESEVLRRTASADPVLRMPPAHMGHQPLAPEDLEILRRWIEAGAEYKTHWAFVSPNQPASPATSTPDWPLASLDAFVLARLDTERLTPSAKATNAQWLRRMTLDVNGLPPTPADLRAFEEAVNLRGEQAYGEAVDRALSSPRYGERMAMDWLDVARYADTHGFNNDSERSMWRWRDWVIDAFNRNQPYDRFIIEQLAGDLLPQLVSSSTSPPDSTETT